MVKRPGDGIGAEAARGFLLELGHAKVAFGLVAVEGSAPVGEETQDLAAALVESLNKVVGRGLFDPPAGAGTAGTGRIAGFGFAKDGVVLGQQAERIQGFGPAFGMREVRPQTGWC